MDNHHIETRSGDHRESRRRTSRHVLRCTNSRLPPIRCLATRNLPRGQDAAARAAVHRPATSRSRGPDETRSEPKSGPPRTLRSEISSRRRYPSNSYPGAHVDRVIESYTRKVWRRQFRDLHLVDVSLVFERLKNGRLGTCLRGRLP